MDSQKENADGVAQVRALVLDANPKDQPGRDFLDPRLARKGALANLGHLSCGQIPMSRKNGETWGTRD